MGGIGASFCAWNGGQLKTRKTGCYWSYVWLETCRRSSETRHGGAHHHLRGSPPRRDAPVHKRTMINTITDMACMICPWTLRASRRLDCARYRESIDSMGS